MMERIFLFFIDGIGIGPCSDGSNPIRNLFSPVIEGRPFCGIDTPVRFPEGILIPADATMGVAGVPQSATGQTALFTGVNTPAFLGYHLTAFPNEALLPVIAEHSIMKVLRNRGRKVTSANLYSREHFKSREGKRRNMFSATTLTIRASGVPFRYEDDFLRGKALFADITGEFALRKGYPIPLITPEEGADRLLAAWEGHDFILFEYFLTDTYGHKKNRDKILQCVDTLNRFLEQILRKIDPTRDAVLIISDHGNAEDITSGDHTLNPVPCILFSRDEKALSLFEESVHDLTDVYRGILSLMG